MSDDHAVPPWLQRHRWAVGRLIRHQRIRAELTQVELGERIGADHKTISRWENGVTELGIDQLARIANALSIASAELLPAEKHSPRPGEDEPHSGH